jgi:hypothetical protein
MMSVHFLPTPSPQFPRLCDLARTSHTHRALLQARSEQNCIIWENLLRLFEMVANEFHDFEIVHPSGHTMGGENGITSCA